MKTNLKWATPVVIGSFFLSAVTGILMFFHLDTGVNKLAHEWLSWVLVGGVVLHLLNNLFAFKRYFGQVQARWLMGALALVLAGSFVPWGGPPEEHPQAVVMKQVLDAPLPTLAALAGVPTDTLRQRLAAQGLQASNDNQTMRTLVGPDVRRQIQTLAKVLAIPAPPKAPT